MQNNVTSNYIKATGRKQPTVGILLRPYWCQYIAVVVSFDQQPSPGIAIDVARARFVNKIPIVLLRKHRILK